MNLVAQHGQPAKARPPSPLPSNHTLHDSTPGGSLAARLQVHVHVQEWKLRLVNEISYNDQIRTSNGIGAPSPAWSNGFPRQESF
jgi:hypothetical protein